MARIDLNALTYLPVISLSLTASEDFSLSSLKSVLYTVEEMQARGASDGVYSSVRCKSTNPSVDSLWQITKEGVNFDVVFLQEDLAAGPGFLSSFRDVRVNITDNGRATTVRGALHLLDAIERMERVVEARGSDLANDGTFSNLVVKGSTPFERFFWALSKSGNQYVAEPLGVLLDDGEVPEPDPEYDGGLASTTVFDDSLDGGTASTLSFSLIIDAIAT